MEEEYNSPQDSRLGSREESRSESTGSPMMIDLSARSGGRPTGSSRRAIRQQQAWEAEQAAILKQQQEARQIEEFQKNQRIKDLPRRTIINSWEVKYVKFNLCRLAR